MELSHNPLALFSSARGSSSLHGKNSTSIFIPTKVTWIPEICYRDHILSRSTKTSFPNNIQYRRNSNLFIKVQNSLFRGCDRHASQNYTVAPFWGLWLNRNKAKANQIEETDDCAPERELNYNDVLVKFLRPYAMIGIFMLCMGYMGRTCMESPELLKWSLLPKAVASFVAVLSTVAYNIGLNQLCDIEIDRINKPDLVLASGDLPLGLARALVTSYFFIGILTSAFVQSKVLMACICIKFFFVYMYNAPPIRLKRTSAGAIFCGLVWGLMNSFSAYGAARHIMGLPFQLSLPVIFVTTFTTVFHATICILKDLPDVEGDRKFGVNTLAVMFGKRAVALLGSGILMHNYVFAIIMAIKNPQVFRQVVMIPAHIVMACILVYQVRKLEKAKYNKEDSQVFYKCLWKLVDAEWAIFPFI